jgi:hypothetical protein
MSGADPGFQVRGGALKKIAPSGGRREIFWGISCEKSRFYAIKSYFFPILGGARAGCAPLDPPLYVVHHCYSGSDWSLLRLWSLLVDINLCMFFPIICLFLCVLVFQI